jgi:pyruvate ferredoxin oxidoreductase alpha subunit
MRNMKNNLKPQFLEGSRAVSLTIANIQPDVISAYPITPQTHIVEDLAKFKSQGKVDYEYLRAESEFAAASIVVGASAAGSRVYSATSSQGLILMMEVLYNASGLRLPVVMTVANRAVGGPISIWNDHSDAMAMRDSGWMMLFAENHQEAVDLHVIAYKLAEEFNLPATVNIDGFILTHSFENVIIPSKTEIEKYLPVYKPALGTYLNPLRPITLGALFTPDHFWLEKKRIDEDLKKIIKIFSKNYQAWKKILPSPAPIKAFWDDGLTEYCGPKNPTTLLIAMGSVVGTIKEALKTDKNTGILKIRSYRPFPVKSLQKAVRGCKRVAVVEKAMSSGASGPLYSDVAAALPGFQGIGSNHIVGLGGRDINIKTIKTIIRSASKAQIKFW